WPAPWAEQAVVSSSAPSRASVRLRYMMRFPCRRLLGGRGIGQALGFLGHQPLGQGDALRITAGALEAVAVFAVDDEGRGAEHAVALDQLVGALDLGVDRERVGDGDEFFLRH